MEDRKASGRGRWQGSRSSREAPWGYPVAPGPLQGEAKSDLAKYLDWYSERCLWQSVWKMDKQAWAVREAGAPVTRARDESPAGTVPHAQLPR